MNRQFFFLFAFLVLMGNPGFSQEQNAPQRSNSFDLGLSASGGKFSAAASWSRLHGVAIEKRFKVGYGIRFTSFVAANKYYTTAPAKYTSPVQNLGTIFSKNIDANIDTITTATASTNSLNLAVYLQFDISPKLDAGFNIDAVGLSFGPKKQFNIISSTFDPNQAPVQSGSPTRFNLLLTSDNDIGSLNSEFYLRYWVTEKVGLRLGFTFLFSEYRTDNELSFNGGQVVNDRYRYKAGMALLAVSFKP
jgi:hypothetical protein